LYYIILSGIPGVKRIMNFHKIFYFLGTVEFSFHSHVFNCVHGYLFIKMDHIKCLRFRKILFCDNRFKTTCSSGRDSICQLTDNNGLWKNNFIFRHKHFLLYLLQSIINLGNDYPSSHPAYYYFVKRVHCFVFHTTSNKLIPS